MVQYCVVEFCDWPFLSITLKSILLYWVNHCYMHAANGEVVLSTLALITFCWKLSTHSIANITQNQFPCDNFYYESFNTKCSQISCFLNNISWISKDFWAVDCMHTRHPKSHKSPTFHYFCTTLKIPYSVKGFLQCCRRPRYTVGLPPIDEA